MRFFFDTEFIEDGKTIDLISIGIVAENGAEFYACSTEAQLHRANTWVRGNVLPHLPPYGHPTWRSRFDIREGLALFVRQHTFDHDESRYEKPEFWAYYADYDWVAICQLFGTMMGLPSKDDAFGCGWPKFCMDLKQLSVMCGSPKHPPDPEDEHNALFDARWNRDLYVFLMARYAGQPVLAGGSP